MATSDGRGKQGGMSMALLQLHDVKKIYDQGKIEVPPCSQIDGG